MDGDGEQAEQVGAPSPAFESLACVSCRSRKLKCDRVKPECGRCARVMGECVYPESRRKPAFKRRNVKELEERLAQVEDLLREASKAINGGAPAAGDLDSRVNIGMDDFAVDIDTFVAIQNGLAGEREAIDAPPDFPPSSQNVSESQPPGPGFGHQPPGELMGLGLSESLPPFEMMEELNKVFFERQAHFLPVIHPGRYLQSFYSAPHKRPPMCLQYAVWAMASNGHERYSQYHDIFYKRARQYADADEMRGYGEHFMTIQHAQAWALIATYEARSMYFTRASMSTAKGVRLVEMMGLHRLDGDGHVMAPTLAPPTSWVDLEERRRTFWGMYCVDCHASISTGWPTLIDPNDITTHLPSSEEAFDSCREEKTSSMQDAFRGATYSTFAGAIIICYVFNLLLKHIHRQKPEDRPGDVEHGEFWKRHRDLDNLLSSAFMFLPDRFRLPQGVRDPTAIHTNLNLHASVICLHHAAIDRIETHSLPELLKVASQLRLRTAAEEVASIIKLSSHVSHGFKSPLAALSLYSAASVYIYFAKSDPKAGISMADLQNLRFIVQVMEGIGRKHVITQAFLQQVYMDIEQNGLLGVIDVPSLSQYKKTFGWTSSNIPLLARSSISKHTEIQPPLPGRLPLGNPTGTTNDTYLPTGPGCHGPVAPAAIRDTGETATTQSGSWSSFSTTSAAQSENGPVKRKRTSLNPSLGTTTQAQRGVPGGMDSTSGFAQGFLRATGGTTTGAPQQVNLPHRTSLTAQSPSTGFSMTTSSQSGGGSSSSSTTTKFGLVGVPNTEGVPGYIGNINSSYVNATLNEVIELTSIQSQVAGVSTWESQGLQYAPSTDSTPFLDFESGDMDSWNMLDDVGNAIWTNTGEGAAAATGGEA